MPVTIRMGLTLTIGHPGDVFNETYSQEVETRLRERLPSLRFESTESACSDDLAWSWWSEMQEFVANAVGEEACPHLLFADDWQSVFVPVETECFVLAQADDRPIGISFEGGLPDFLANKIREKFGPDVDVEAKFQEEAQAALAEFPDEEQSGLRVASLPALIRELEAGATAVGAKVDSETLQQFLAVADQVEPGDEPEGEDGDENALFGATVCLAWTLLLGRQAMQAGQALWVVK